jgi:hypothetical protein
MRPTTWLVDVVGVVGAVAPLGAVGATGAGADHEIGATFGDWGPDDGPPVSDEGCDIDEPVVVRVGEPVVVRVDEPVVDREVACDAEPDRLAVDGAPPVVVERDPVPSEPADPASCPDTGRLFEASGDGFDEPPPTERTSPTTSPATASPPTTAALPNLVRRDTRIG